ncbi:MAG: hypothetical protein K6C14_01120 [Eubacterium sp.]|nr:hypothetical protein [Eubacterium sp.]
MFYQIKEKLEPVEPGFIDYSYVTAGYVESDELEEVSKLLGFSQDTVNACKKASGYYRSVVEIYDDYTFTELRIASPNGVRGREDCVALYVKKNMIIVVDVEDFDSSTKNIFMDTVSRFTAENATLEKVIYSFLENLIINDFKYVENKGNEIAKMEENVLKGKTSESFSLELLSLKREFLTLHNYYEQLLDITDAFEENENDVFDDEDLRYISNLSLKVTRLREDVDSLSSEVTHLQDAYSSFLDLNLNHTMKFFTVITSIFFPLTLIAGWYGMNFNSMPEFTWKYGYIYVIALSVTVVLVLTIIGKKRKWF